MRKRKRVQQDAITPIEPGMVVKSSDGDLGDEDISKPRIKNVIHDEKGNVQEIVVQKGVLFKEELQIPADRIEEVDAKSSEESSDKVIIDASEKEIESMTPFGHTVLSSKGGQEQQQQRDLLDAVQHAIPTVEGMREREIIDESEATASQQAAAPTIPSPQEGEANTRANAEVTRREVTWWKQFGPGFLGGMSGNDSSAVTAYVINGAQSGFGNLWLMLLATPMYQAVVYSCAKLGHVSQKGFVEVLREHYGLWVAVLASLVLIIANVALIAADLVAIGTGFQLMTNVSWLWFVVPIAAILWYLTVFSNFNAIKKIFIVMSLAFVTYFIAAFLAHPHWNTVLFNTFVPHLSFDFASISTAVALLGATMSPYTMVWQVQGEKEEQRPGTPEQQMRFALFDVSSGVISGNAISYFIIVTAAATLFVQHKHIATAADAATSMVPIVGPYAKYLFAIGLIGAGLVAIPVLLASTSYAIANTFGWPSSLSKKPWQSEGFYLTLTLALAASLFLALLHVDPITLIFWANMLCGVLAPILVFFLLLVGNNRAIMGNQRLGWLTNLWLTITVLVLVAGAVLLFYGLATGQGGL